MTGSRSLCRTIWECQMFNLELLPPKHVIFPWAIVQSIPYFGIGEIWVPSFLSPPFCYLRDGHYIPQFLYLIKQRCSTFVSLCTTLHGSPIRSTSGRNWRWYHNQLHLTGSDTVNTGKKLMADGRAFANMVVSGLWVTILLKTFLTHREPCRGVRVAP